MKKLIVGFIAVAFLAGCGAENSKENSSETPTIEDKTILYSGTVIDFDETYTDGLFLADLTPLNSSEAASFEEVILLTEDIALVDQKSGESIAPSELVKGNTVKVTLIEHAPTTMSLPLQIASIGIVKIEKVTKE
ncbi:hypothetical protein SAMN04488700_1672 [Carnobacterium iners]|uniref:Lipoprotein n=1 Tax=Carnobacterium iners TaxID=1073423 RepID=A0A1X7NAA4_9LACT|nr:hypothetical protein [Carnobacterium iners]SEK50986.1 hypothetical protein SAMN04488114_10534 [Carnobacterium iners]SMH34514.1 hypothetical protein SAMN04488700_1672 [Carnobacterium iners]